MDKFNKSQVLKLSFIAALLIIAPFLPSSLKPPYFYFLVNLLIISLGTEAGILSFFSKQQPSDDRKNTAITVPKSVNNPSEYNSSDSANMSMEMDKCQSEKNVRGASKLHKVGDGDQVEAEMVMMVEEREDEDHNEEDISGQELYHKAETFIGNFYGQLKMERDQKSHDRYIHGFL